MGKTRPPYPAQFREEAVRLVRESGNSRARIAKDLGVSEQSLYTWAKQADLDGGKRADGLATEERTGERDDGSACRHAHHATVPASTQTTGNNA